MNRIVRDAGGRITVVSDDEDVRADAPELTQVVDEPDDED